LPSPEPKPTLATARLRCPNDDGVQELPDASGLPGGTEIFDFVYRCNVELAVPLSGSVRFDEHSVIAVPKPNTEAEKAS
jgi:hypothetical protein